jgi:hypothetical protein
MLIIIDSSRISKYSKDQYRITNLLSRQTTKRRRRPCQKHKWKRKERENKRPGLSSSISTSSRTNSGKTTHRFWSNYMRGLLQSYFVVGRMDRCRVSIPVTASFLFLASHWMTSVSLLQLLHLQITVNVSHTSCLSGTRAELGPATDIRPAVHAIQYAQPCFRRRLRRRLRR